MAKNNDLVLWAIVGILAFAVFGNQAAPPVTPPSNGGGGGGSVDLCTVVEPDASFTAQNLYVAGTALTSEAVRVIKNGGTKKDLGLKSTNSGTLNTAANQQYMLYWGENSTVYYTQIESYTAPCQDATDDKVGRLCTMDTTPTLTIFDEDGNAVSNTNNQTLGTSTSIDNKLRIKVSSDQCYGNPDLGKEGLMNAACFRYNTTSIASVTSNAPAVAIPYIIGNNNITTGFGVSCYGFPTLADNEEAYIDFTIKSTASAVATESDTPLNTVAVFVDDIAFDLNANTLEEIKDYQDEVDTKNELGVTTNLIVAYAQIV